MKILVTGPGGTTGERLARRLVDAGHALTLFAPEPFATDLPEGAKVEHVTGEVTGRRAIAEAAHGCDAVVHLATAAAIDAPLSAARRARLFQVDVEGARNVVDACLEAGVKRLVHRSSHLCPGETDPADGSAQVLARRLAEGEVWRAGARGVTTIVLAPAFSVDDPAGPFTRLLVDLADARIPIFPEATRIAVVAEDDVVRAHLAALTKGTPGGRYLLQGGRLSWQKLGDLVGLATGWPVVMRPVRQSVAEVAARLDRAILARVRRRRPLGGAQRLRALIHAPADDARAAERDLGLEYTDVEAALSAHLDRLVAEHRIGGD